MDDSLVDYIQSGGLPSDTAEAKVVKRRAVRYCMIQDPLYRRSYTRPYLKCMSEEESRYVLDEVHRGVCGAHIGYRALAHKVLRTLYFWPTFQKDAKLWVKKCDNCQRSARVPRIPPNKLTSITSPWPFVVWDLDIIGPFPGGRTGKVKKFILVTCDYFTKWAEAEPTTSINAKAVEKFL
ncbi:Gypsy retrotransposon integrase-like protein 1 [Quillaja saponaria]|uniref:Gypsy retrotransposon integrase-like protein 1 n=1 Tax=Quillaja saponaria TaxID=32244 RepID=A0AAD7M3H6_QUISA|nr:Gypsy retrotransposon integrase-like protein 1 [Quillaja saponaria]